MEYIISSSVSFNVLDISASMEMHIEEKAVVHYEEYQLILRAIKSTNIVLDSGKHLSDVDINLTLSSKFKSSKEIDRELTEDDLGFLAHIEDSDGSPFVHGTAPLIDRTVLQNLFNKGTKGYVTIQLPTVPFEDDTTRPYVFKKNRPNMLRISGLSVSSISTHEDDNDE
ncbi:MAG: hypothetical protein ABW080_00430 [Candidatus Thiodiazotropha sp.]